MHGVALSYEAIREWSLKFGQNFANELRRRCLRPGDKWHMDEKFIRVNGKDHQDFTSSWTTSVFTKQSRRRVHPPHIPALTVWKPRYCPRGNPIERARGFVPDICTRNHKRVGAGVSWSRMSNSTCGERPVG